jgi:hypothetical protein
MTSVVAERFPHRAHARDIARGLSPRRSLIAL